MAGTVNPCVTFLPVTVQAQEMAQENDLSYLYKDSEFSASLLLGDEVRENNITFLDGEKLGITDPTDLLYNERVVHEGIDARKQYRGSELFMSVDKSFMEEGDDEFIFSVMCYDLGTGEGAYYFRYHADDGTRKDFKIMKPGKKAAWLVRSQYINDIDFDGKFDNGTTIRSMNGAYNIFKKIEIINVSKAKREGKAIIAPCVESEPYEFLKEIGIIDNTYSYYAEKNYDLSKLCTLGETVKLVNAITGKNEVCENPEKVLTQGALLRILLQNLGIDAASNPIDAATKAGLIQGIDLYTVNEAPATLHNLVNASYRMMYYKDKYGQNFAIKLVESGRFRDFDIKKATDENFVQAFFAKPVKCPAENISDIFSGRTYKYVNFFGEDLWRPYVTASTWTTDGKNFICGTKEGLLFIYNIEKEELRLMEAKVKTAAERINATMGTDDCIYYIKADESFWKVDTKTGEKKKLFQLAGGTSLYTPSVTNDGKYVSFEIYDTKQAFSKATESVVPRYNLEEDKFEFWTIRFDKPPETSLNHTQINPVYPNLIYFGHEWNYTPKDCRLEEFDERQWILNTDTGEMKKFTPGGTDFRNDGRIAIMPTHEHWSKNGERFYFINLLGSNEGTVQGPCAVRMDKDGRHRQYFYTSESASYSPNHLGVSGNEKFLFIDQGTVHILSTETLQSFPIVAPGKTLKDVSSHPYSPHPIGSATHNIFDWGQVQKGILGVAWFDYNEIIEKELAKGGRYKIGENAEYVSYEGLPCEVKNTKKNGKECLYIPRGNSLYLDIDESIVDSTDAGVKITFDYFSKDGENVDVIYTRSVKSEVDKSIIEDQKRVFRPKRKGSWQKGSVTIDSANFETPGLYFSDLKISGNIYITNIKVERK